MFHRLSCQQVRLILMQNCRDLMLAMHGSRAAEGEGSSPLDGLVTIRGAHD